MLDVHDYIAVVDQHPATTSLSLASNRFRSGLTEFVLDLIDDGPDKAFVVRAGNDEGVGYRQLFTDVVRQDRLSLLVVGCLSRDGNELECAIGGGHGESSGFAGG